MKDTNMQIPEYPSNSKTTRVEKTERVIATEKTAAPAPETPAKPKIEKIVTGEVVQRKKGLGKKFKETFFGGDDAQGVWGYVVQEVIVPQAQILISEAVTGAVERAVYGDSRPRSSGRSASTRPGGGGGGPFVNYSKFSGSSNTRRDPRDDPRPVLSRSARRDHDFGEIVLATRAEGNEVLRRLDLALNEYESVSVSDLYSALGITPEWTDEKYGWFDLRGASVHRTRGGFVLDMPRPVPLD